MPRGVMVARRILVPPVRVRILPGQQKRMLLRVYWFDLLGNARIKATKKVL